MKIGVAIPCYVGHIDKLRNLLDSIDNQTRLPDKVVVSCSSTIDHQVFPNYKFPFEIVYDEAKKNTAQNRNIAAERLLDNDIISFIDADDIMHPQRIEFIERAFEGGADIVLHNFENYENDTNVKSMPLFDTCNIYYNTMHRSGGMIVHKKTDIGDIHHAQVCVTTNIYCYIKFNESEEYVTKADCVFCWYVFSLEGITDAYISNKLSAYIPSGTCHTF